MFEIYYVNKDPSNNPHNNHEVHTESCQWCPGDDHRQYLGFFDNCYDAVEKAKHYFSNVDGCKTCCPQCNHDH